MPVLFLCVTSALTALLFNSITFYAELVLSESLNIEGNLTSYVGLRILSVLPYLILSVVAGSLSDKYSKTKVLVVTQFIGLLGAVFSGYGILVQNSAFVLIGALILGIQTALMSPSKYGLIPELVGTDKVSEVNGKVEMSTFLAILLGVSLGGVLHSLHNLNFPLICFIILSLGSIVSASFIKNSINVTRNENIELKYNPFSILSTSKLVRQIPNLSLAIFLSSFILSLGAFIQLNIPIFGRTVLDLGSIYISILFASLGIGIGLGSYLAGLASRSKIELGLVPLGAITSALALFLMSAFTQVELAIFFMFLTGLGSGFVIVPVHSFIQTASPEDKKGEVLAFLNFCAFSGIIFASLFYLLLSNLGITTRAIFSISGFFTLAVALKLILYYPGIFLRTINWLIANCLYDLTKIGIDNIPKEGGALLISNHMSFVDASLLLAACPRPIRFIMYRGIYEAPGVHSIARAMNAIPIAPEDGPRSLVRSLEIAKEAIKNGELVCIFAEGQITRIGRTLPFQKGFERIVQGLDVSVIPVYLHGLWGSVFSFAGGKFFWKLPHKIPYPVTVVFGEAINSVNASATKVREEVLALSGTAIDSQISDKEDILTSVIKTAKRMPFKKIVADSLGIELTYLRLFVASIFVSKNLKVATDKEKIGILLPALSAGMISNLATLYSVKIPVNLNFTVSKESLEYSIRKCEIDTIITSKKAHEKYKDILPADIKLIYIDEVLKELTLSASIKPALEFIFKPTFLISKKQKNELATVMFSSGSTGQPKGIMLSQGNIRSNLFSFGQVFDLKSDDVILGVLPLFHSFGFTVTLWLPLVAGIKVVYHYDPIDTKRIGELAQKNEASILLATPTFLGMYLKRITKEQFANLRICVVGAEKLRASLADAFEEKYGFRPLEGYGCTELSPVATINTNDIKLKGIKQTGNKVGTVGHPIPGVSVKTVDPDTYETITGKPGLLMIKGPNVMLGYLGDQEKTNTVIKDGWYETGDIALIDDEGFVTITDRLSRFSKIGGEMVAHGKVEEELHKALGIEEQVLAVTGVPDDKKGERLVIVTTVEIDMTIVSEKLANTGLPNLWIPKADSVIKVEKLPILGTGKLDLKGLKGIAER